jgi:dipeptidyl-peptidase-4
VIELPSHKAVRALTDPSAVTAKVKPLLNPPAEFFRIDIGEGVQLDGYMLKPSTFDASKKYPFITHVYGEPAGQTVNDSWGGSQLLFHRALAEAGYIIISIDNRGTPAPRGTAWRKIIYGTGW